MTEWREVMLGQALDVKHGFAFRGEFFSDKGELIVLTPGNFYDGGGFKQKSGSEKYYDGPVPEGYLLRQGAIVVAMTEQAHGLLGSSATIPEDNRYLHNQRLGLLLVTDPEHLDRRFCYHLMNAPTVRRQIQATATGSKVRHTAPERIRAIWVALPDVEVQRVVAGILDALDDLIENNRRRVEALEQMAQAIYREWFIRFRYPGHESTTLVDSAVGMIPESWPVGTVEDHLVLQRGFDLPTKKRHDGKIPVLAASGVQGSHSEPRARGPGVVTGRSGTVGVVTYVATDYWPLNTVLWVKEFRLATPLSAYFLLSSLDLTQVASGAAVPTLNRNHVHGLPVVCPPHALITDWDTRVQPMFSVIEIFRQQIRALVGIRNLLLPKLVTGQVDVSYLDLDAV